MNRVRTEIRLVSDSMDVDGWQHVPPNAIYSNDYYAIVMDDFEVVSTLDSPLFPIWLNVNKVFVNLNFA